MRATIFLLLLTSCTVIAQERGEVPADVYAVVSEGYWEHGDAYGTYRVIVRNDGWEHVQSVVYVQWMRVDPVAKQVVAVQSVKIDGLVGMSIGTPKIVGGQHPQLELEGTNVYTLEEKAFRFRLGAPGMIEPVVP